MFYDELWARAVQLEQRRLVFNFPLGFVENRCAARILCANQCSPRFSGSLSFLPFFQKPNSPIPLLFVPGA